MTNVVVGIVVAFMAGFCIGAFLAAITVLRAKATATEGGE